MGTSYRAWRCSLANLAPSGKQPSTGLLGPWRRQSLPYLHPAGLLNKDRIKAWQYTEHISNWVETRELTGGKSCSSESDTGGFLIFFNIYFFKIYLFNNFGPYPVACVILVSWPGIEPTPPALGGGVFLFILAALGFHYCVGFSLVVVSGGYSLVVVHTLLTAVGFPVGKHRL